LVRPRSAAASAVSVETLGTERSNVTLLLSALLLLTPLQGHPAASTRPDPSVAAAIEQLFDAMRRGDGGAAAALFLPDARLETVVLEGGAPTVQSVPVADFVRAIGTPRSAVWDERIANLQIHLDGDLAAAWMDYAFYVDQEFSHCGVNVVQLLRTSAGWRILSIIDTRRGTDCGYR
jgi:hypothetical protein